MANINLTTSDFSQKEKLPYKKGITSVIVVLVLLIGVYIWLSLAQNSVDKNIQDVNKTFLSEYNQLAKGNSDIINFQNRLITAKGLLSQSNTALNSLAALEKNLIPGTYLETYNLASGKTLAVDLIADNYEVLARQMMNFKKSNSFSGVSVGDTSLNSSGKIKAAITLSVN